MIIFCILGFSIIFITLIIWIFGREEEDFKIDGRFDRKEDKEEEFYRRLEDSSKVSYRLSPVRSNYREPEKGYNRVNTGYNAILDSPEWRACREWVFANKGRYCSYCKSGWNLRVHHKYYLKYPDGEHIKPWEYNIDCYMVLCDDCHKKVHEKYQIKTYYIRRG